VERVGKIAASLVLASLAAWRSGNTLSQINEVTLRWARLVLGWVTVHGTKLSQLLWLSPLPSVGW